MKDVTYSFIKSLPRSWKRSILLLVDVSVVLLSLYSAFALSFNQVFPFQGIGQSWVLFPLLAMVCAALSIAHKLPMIKLGAFDNSALVRIGVCAVELSIAAMVLSYILELNTPHSVSIILGISFFFGVTLARQAGYSLLHALNGPKKQNIPVAIYGAGSAGVQLALALRQTQTYKPVVFVDDNPALHGQILAGVQVQAPDMLATLAQKGRIQKVLVAIPSISKPKRKALLVELAKIAIEVRVLPSFVEMLAGHSFEANLQTVSSDALLGREKVRLSGLDISMAYEGRYAMVTGAGGSIGSELCRHLVDCGISKIVLFEHSEFALYEIDQALREIAPEGAVEVVSRLGSVTDRARLEKVISEERIDIVLHAAAYKHVPLVEENQLEGARNNVRGTQVVAEVACALKVERFILVSTDKAVRPTNVMGATKRLAEMVVQDLQFRNPYTKLAIVRFGNVLGSSGSVLPLFQQQIRAGGPVTVTHKDVTRFFMTIPEAARLVLLAGAYSRGGDVFVLDMGKPKKIIDIARRMIEESGRSVRDELNPGGDVELKITGLRPGEKLFEEMLLDEGNLKATMHKKVLRAEEAFLSEFEVAAMLKDLKTALSTGSIPRLRLLIERYVEGYHHQSHVPQKTSLDG